MGSRIPLILSLFLLPLSLVAETASDYANRGAQKYIFGQEDSAKAEVEEGLAKFPNDPELKGMLGLFRDKEQPDKSDPEQDKKDQPQDQQQQQQDSGKDQNQNSDKDQPSPTPSPGEEEQNNGPGESPTPTPSPAEGDESGASPTPTPGEEATPSPTPGEGKQSDNENGEPPTPTPAGTPDKPLTGDVKGAGEQNPPEQPPAEAAEAEPEKEGEMSPKQAALLLQAMKDEEQKVQLDEHKPVRPVYNDW